MSDECDDLNSFSEDCSKDLRDELLDTSCDRTIAPIRNNKYKTNANNDK